MEPLLAYVIAAHEEDGEDLLVALHEAGHVVLAMGFAVLVHKASIIPTPQFRGYVEHDLLWKHREADVHVGSDWLNITIGMHLAGDRALRLHSEFAISACGGLESDYAHAMRLLEAVLRHDKAKVEPELDRVTRWVDDFFRYPLVQRRLAVVTAALLSKRTLTGVDLKKLFCPPRTCGAIAPDGQGQCVSDHCGPRGRHYLRWGRHDDDRGEWQLPWSSEGRRVLVKDRSPEWLAVRKALQSPLPNPRARPIPPVEEVPALLLRGKNHRLGRREQERAFSAAGRALSAHIREANRIPLRQRELAELDLALGSIGDQHAEECGRPLDPDLAPDGEVWCPWCAFEFPVRSKGWAYLVTMRGDGEQPVVLGALISAAEAQAAVRIHASYGNETLWVDRVPAGRLRTGG
jgi:hypothetical protein